MSFFALILVIIAAILHATWNLIAKKSKGNILFAFTTGICSAVIWLPTIPLVYYFSEDTFFAEWNLKQWFIVLLSGIIHAIYYTVLLRGYQVAPLTVVYPVARGSGPLISSFLAIIIFNEPYTAYSVSGVLLIVSGIVMLSLKSKLQAENSLENYLKGTLWGVFTGMAIASYTLIDAYGIKQLGMNPLYYEYWAGLFRVVALAPFIIRRLPKVKIDFMANYKAAIIIAVLGPLAYILVLTAMKFAPVSHVAPLREISMLFAVFLGGKFLQEGSLTRKIISSFIIAVGVALLTA